MAFARPHAEGVSQPGPRDGCWTRREPALDRVLLVCMQDNIAAVKTIERLGGVLEDAQDTEYGAVRRHWIAL